MSVRARDQSPTTTAIPFIGSFPCGHSAPIVHVPGSAAVAPRRMTPDKRFEGGRTPPSSVSTTAAQLPLTATAHSLRGGECLTKRSGRDSNARPSVSAVPTVFPPGRTISSPFRIVRSPRLDPTRGAGRFPFWLPFRVIPVKETHERNTIRVRGYCRGGSPAGLYTFRRPEARHARGPRFAPPTARLGIALTAFRSFHALRPRRNTCY